MNCITYSKLEGKTKRINVLKGKSSYGYLKTITSAVGRYSKEI